ncbi:hypothetical protein QTI17_34590 [Variovorax sp. J31P179]|uniref:hypothetical protein n=1 Tax=Variovorax sp. J31P179 TaxID=3053508 RepID=UPI002575E663|nr:hypothetical protein [Variovorax sp. J31P179]MDM0085719.1 hypothetical protein [Variovorax sp. J31P179]
MLGTIRVVRRVMGGKASALTAEATSTPLDEQVDPGVYKLSLQPLTPLEGSPSKVAGRIDAPAGAPNLVLIHGTFSRTLAKLWQTRPTRVEKLFGHYGPGLRVGPPHAGRQPVCQRADSATQVPDNA